jgi:hypothetical protein
VRRASSLHLGSPPVLFVWRPRVPNLCQAWNLYLRQSTAVKVSNPFVVVGIDFFGELEEPGRGWRAT